MVIREDHIRKREESFYQSSKAIDSSKLGLTKEQLLSKHLKHLASEYNRVEDLKKKFVNLILKNKEKLNFRNFIENPNYEIKEDFLKKTLETTNIRGLNVVSIDGSSVIKRFMNIDFSFLKAIAVKYYFKKNKQAKIEYFPDLHGFNNYNIKGNFISKNERFIELNTSLDMTFMEIKLLNNYIEKTSDVDMIILDGSVVIMPIDLIFSKDPLINHKYNNLLKEYHKLYKNCQEERILLIGSIKDTRTSALCHLIRNTIQYLKPNHHNLSDFIDINYRQVFDYFSDIDLFNRILHKYERTCIFQCKREVDKIRDTGIRKEIPYYFPLSFYAFYIKCAKYDLPCRIEFFMDEKHEFSEASRKADTIASILLPISSLNNHYGLPIPQIEAHRRAVFKPQEINLLFNSFTRELDKYGINIIEKRRNRRPFK
jgi:hypothetical protein